ncbi:hypothetical protein [Janthinobacterium sp. RB2R34]|uniref:hypothetical protein n=1 Tax=Janthinobacterium sp. RB2R34 TaxID=3424193 RepID=UPI003F1FCFE9
MNANAIDKAANDINNTAQDVRKDAHNAVDKVADKAQPVVNKVATSLHNGVDQVGEKISAVSDSVSSASEKLMERGKEWSAAAQRASETGRTYVRERPATSLLVALAAGYGLSKLLGARK